MDLALRVSMISLGVEDMERSLDFYHRTLGLPISGAPGEVTLVRAGEITLVLNRPFGRASAGKIAGAVEIIFPAASVATAHAELAHRGCSFAREPREVTPGTWAATFTDPDGHRLTVLGPR